MIDFATAEQGRIMGLLIDLLYRNFFEIPTQQVTAKFIECKAEEFYQKLTDGSIENQKPDGPEMVDSMHRASIVKSVDYVVRTVLL